VGGKKAIFEAMFSTKRPHNPGPVRVKQPWRGALIEPQRGSLVLVKSRSVLVDSSFRSFKDEALTVPTGSAQHVVT
jgi:hypothetical protein